MADPILLPTFAHGTVGPIKRRVKTEARRWVSTWRRTGRFPDLEETAVPEGTGVYVSYNDDLAQLDPASEAWRLYFLDELWVSLPFSDDEWERLDVWARVAEHRAARPWGALLNGLSHQRPNTIARVAPRIRGLLDHWETLAGLRYLTGPAGQFWSLAELLGLWLDGAIAMWSEAYPAPDVRAALAAALANMEAATPEEAYQRLAPAICRVAAGIRDLEQPAHLADVAWVEAHLATLDRRWVDSHTGGQAIRELLFQLDDGG